MLRPWTMMSSRLVGSWLVAVAFGAVGCKPAEYGHLRAHKLGDLTLGQVARAPYDEKVTAACGSGGLTPHGSTSVLRTPYLQKVTARSASIYWTARAADGVTIEVSTSDGEPVLTVAAAVDESAPVAGGAQYFADLAPLEPDTLYCYTLRDVTDDLTMSTGFRTAPLPGTGTPLRFAAYGDSGKRTGDQEAVANAMRTVPFDLMLNTGDLAGDSGTLAEYETTFFQPYASFLDRIPSLVAIGNHEYTTDQGAPFRQVFGLFENGGPDGLERWYSADWGDVHFVALDTNVVGPVQAAWLEADLSANLLPWTVVILHHPPFSSGTHGSDLSVRQTFVPILAAHHVPLVLEGHDHDYERSKAIDGITYIVTGGGGRGTRDVDPSKFTAFCEQVAHFVYGVLSGDELRLYAIDATGQEFDTVLVHR